MEKLRIQPNNYEPSTSRSDSSFETINKKPQKNCHKSYSWCIPRKTKTVNSTGEISIDHTSTTNIRKKKFRNRTKAHKTREKLFQSQKRINELSRPRIFLESSWKSQQNSKVNLKKSVSRSRNSSLSLTNFEISTSATNSKSISRQEWMDRINKLAEPRRREPTPTNIIGKVAEKALKASASKRIKELAKRKPLKLAGSQKEDQDPYKVSPQALKAICSTRIKSLATPKIFNLHSHYCNTVKKNC